MVLAAATLGCSRVLLRASVLVLVTNGALDRIVLSRLLLGVCGASDEPGRLFTPFLWYVPAVVIGGPQAMVAMLVSASPCPVWLCLSVGSLLPGAGAP
jgi:hypothetical protein